MSIKTCCTIVLFYVLKYLSTIEARTISQLFIQFFMPILLAFSCCYVIYLAFLGEAKIKMKISYFKNVT
jgi:hypothetical protein